MGGIGAGMLCLEGTGAFSHVSLRHTADVFNEPLMFAALHVAGQARVLEGPVPMRKAFGSTKSTQGLGSRSYGLPRFAEASFETRFPFGIVRLKDTKLPVSVELTGWSPFTPGDADSSSLPVAGLEYRFVNLTNKPVRGVFSFHARNFMKLEPTARGPVTPVPGGFVLASAGEATARHVASWQISRVFPRTVPVVEMPCVKLADPLDWQPAKMFNYLANAHARFNTQDGMTYIGTRVRVAAAGTWIFSIGHDGGMRLFVDGQPAAAEGRRENPHRPGRTEVTVALDKGEHELMFVLDLSGGGGWGISLAFKPTGNTTGLPEPDAWTPKPPAVGSFAACVSHPDTRVDCAWFRGSWFDPLTMLWNAVAAGEMPEHSPHPTGNPSDGGSLSVPVRLKPKGEQTIRVRLAWYVPESDLCRGGTPSSSNYAPWYASRFANIGEVTTFWRDHYNALRARSQTFSDCFYDTTLPAEIVEAVAANLTILKTPTVLRQQDGRLWAWEGCTDTGGCCEGSCTHVWNYAQALPHLFPDLERSLRETEFKFSQDERGHQNFRAAIPIRLTSHQFHAAADGQLGGILKVYREWRISGDTGWMTALWPRVKQSLDFCIVEWDPQHTGTIVLPHHNTYDIEFWGADGMCTSFYLGALQAALAMGRQVGADVALYEKLLAAGKQAMETTLWNGEYFIQKVECNTDPTKLISVGTTYSPEALALLQAEGPKYQYGTGCLADGVIGDWMARVCGVAPVLDEKKSRQHVASVFRYNFRTKLADHANPQRSSYAFGQEGGLLLCSWPKGGKLSLPFVYSNEVWTGIEYQVAAHLIMLGRVKEGLRIVRTLRRRYDGRYRNPFNEYECGHWYARALSSYSLLQAYSGARYDNVTKTLHLQPAVRGDFRAFLSTATGYGTVGVKRGKPFLKVISGHIPIKRIEFTQ